MADIGSRVDIYREEIKHCIVNDMVLSSLRGIIEPDDKVRLTQLYEQDRPKATGQMLDIIKRSPEEGKWPHFIEALKIAEYPHLVYLLETSSRPSQNYDHEKNIIQIFYPHLAKRIDPAEFVAHLYSAKVITLDDMQVINRRHNNVGQQAGAVVLLERIQCRQAPEVWYEKLLDTMMEMGLDDLVKEMEPDIYQDKIESKGVRSFQSRSGTSGASEIYGSIRENVVSDSGDAYVAANNLSPPDVGVDMQQSIDNKDNGQEYSSITQAKKAMYEMKLNVLGDENEEPKTLNIPPVADDEDSEEDFHDAVEAHEEPLTDGQGIEIYNRNELNKDVEAVDEIYNRTQTRQEADEVNELEDSDENNLSSDDEFLTEESEGLNPMEQLQLKLRNYQYELAENAIHGDNTIICAETGSGKTWVALHIVKKHLQQNPNGKVVFMARTGTLIKQQSDRFKTYLTEYETILLTGDSENSSLLAQLVEGFQIFCMTPQILVNNLERNPENSIHYFSMLVFDECHHAKKDEPYNKVMRLYLQEKNDSPTLKLPQIIGLTASIGVGKSTSDVEARDYIIGICANLDSKNLSTVERCKEELKKHVNLPKEEIVQMKSRRGDPCRSILMMAMQEIETKLEDRVVLNPSYVEIMNTMPGERDSQEYTKWTFELMKTARLSDDDYEETRNISTCAKYLSVLNAALEVNSLLRTEDVQKFLGERLGNDLKDKAKLTTFETELLNSITEDMKKMRVYAKGVENPNVRLLSNTLRKMMEEKGEDSRAMVFVKARATCKSLAKFLDSDLAEFGTKVAPLFGKENRDDEEGMTESRQNETVERFRNGDYKVLVATSVGSEGIDVPDCNIVLSYNYTGNEITKIQMSGRSRKKGGATIVVGDEDIVMRETINAYKASMMYRAMKLVKLMPERDFERKIRIAQKEELEKAKFRKRVEELAQSRRVDESLYEIKCARCNSFACYSTDIRTLKGSQHIVADKEFQTRINIKPHRSPKKYEGMTKTSKMFCKNCPLDWGIVLDYNGLPCWTLKLICLKFVNTVTKRVTQYKKWLEVPFVPPEIEYDDLLRLYG